MATTATITTRTLISDALRKIGVVAADEQATADQIVHALRAYNRMAKAWQARGLDLFTVSSMSVAGTTSATYTLSPVRPLEIRSVRIKRAGVETPLQPMTRDEYDRLPAKSAQGTPTGFYYDRQREAATLRVWPVLASAAGVTLEITYTREMEDADLDEAPDFPREFEDAVIYGLAARLADDYMVSAPNVIARAEEELRLALSFDREGSVFFAGPYA